MTAKIEKIWTLERSGGGWLVKGPTGEQGFVMESRARTSIQRKISATLASWGRNGWLLDKESHTEGDPEVFKIVGIPPARNWVAITLRISKEHKAAIEATANDQGVTEADVISNALEHYLTP
jgi:hypothetical protein